MSEEVRIHLNQAILVGYGDEAKYAKVLVGKRDRMDDIVLHRTEFRAFTIFGFVRGYRGFTLDQPTRMRLAESNILAIEDAKIERVDWHSVRYLTKPCTRHNVHDPHTYQNKGPVINCPGKEKVEQKQEPNSQHPQRLMVLPCTLRRPRYPGHAPHHYRHEGKLIQCPGWGEGDK